MVSSRLSKDDLQRAFTWLKAKDFEVAKVIANPLFERFLFEAGVGVPVELDETRLGLDFVGKAANNAEKTVFSIRVCDFDSFSNFKDAVSTVDRDHADTDLKQIRLWRWDDAPECVKQFADCGVQGRWVALVPPDLFGENLDWMDLKMFGYNPDFYMLPGGWRVFYSLH